MNFNFKLFNWNNEGAEPSDDLKANGFRQGYKPAAGIFNRFWYLVTNAITELQQKHGFSRVVDATSTDGVTYTATVEGITELYEGLEITICPDTSNTSNSMTLNLNGLGAKPIRRPLSFSTYVADSAKSGFLHKDAPCRLMYHAEYPNRVDGVSGDGIWLMADKVKTSAQDLYGTVPVESGGTGTNNLADAFYPVGSIYMSVNNVNPSELFGGTWKQLKDRFLLGAGDTYLAGATGGSADAVAVSHRHYMFGQGTDTLTEMTVKNGTADRTVAGYFSKSGVENNMFYEMSAANDTPWRGLTSIEGESGTGKNMPPYLAVYMWQRIS